MALLPVTFSNPEGHFGCLKTFYLTYLWKYSINDMFVHKPETARGL